MKEALAHSLAKGGGVAGQPEWVEQAMVERGEDVVGGSIGCGGA